MEKMVIYGAGGFGREIAWLIEEINRVEPKYEIIGFIDDDSSMTSKVLNTYPVLGRMDYLRQNPDLSVANAVADPSKRIHVQERLSNLKLRYPNLIHPSVLIGDDVSMGAGNVICAGTIITVNIRIGNFCHLNLHTTVGHDSILEDFVTTACSVDFAGYSHMETGTYFGNHATVLPSVRVGALTTVGAGAVVNKNLPQGKVAVGVPAKVIKDNPEYNEQRSGLKRGNGHENKKDLKIEAESQNNHQDRFDNWEYPEIQEGKLTRWNWVVQNIDNFRLGYKADIGTFSYINAKEGVTIEDYVQLGSHCSIYSVSTIDGKAGRVHLKRNCRVGSHTLVMPGVTIGKNSVIGALSFVNTDIPDNVVAVGSPAKVIKKLSVDRYGL